MDTQEKKTVALFFIFTLSFIFLLAIRKEFCSATDSGFLISAGREIWNQGKIIDRDYFSCTFGGHPWLLDRWAPCLFYYLVYQWGGIAGAILAKAALIAAGFFLIGMMLLRERREPLLVFSALALGALVTWDRFDVRPQVVSMLVFAGQIYLTQVYAADRKNRLALLGLFFLLVLWANLHSEWVYGEIYFGLFCLAEAAEAARQRLGKIPPAANRPRELVIIFSVYFLSIFFSVLTVDLINPSGWRVLTLPFLMGQNQYWHRIIIEFKTIYAPPFTGIILLVYAGLLGLGLALNWKKVSIREILFALFFALLLLKFRRTLHVFVLVTLPILVRQWDSFLVKIRAGRKNRPAGLRRSAAFARAGGWMGLTLVMVLILCLLIFKDPAGRFGLGFHQRLYPARAFDFIRDQGLHGNIFSQVDLGGALILFFYPQLKVFIDGRFLDLYDDRFFRKVYLHIAAGMPDWESLLNEYNVDYVLIDRWTALPLRDRIRQSRNWTAIYDGEDAVIFRNSAGKR
ncbi:MAG: hypothetical protein PHE84_15160 [bacterium]|nr:hypothetical protein [bacterium]